jgi:hypothetical protein
MSTFSRDTGPGDGFGAGYYKKMQAEIMALQEQLAALALTLTGYPGAISADVGVGSQASPKDLTVWGAATVKGDLGVGGRLTVGELQANTKAVLPGAVFDASATPIVKFIAGVAYAQPVTFAEDVTFDKGVTINGTFYAETIASDINSDSVVVKNTLKTNQVETFAPPGINLIKYGGLPSITLYHLFETTIPSDLTEYTAGSDIYFFARDVSELPNSTPIQAEIGAVPILTGMRALVLDPNTYYGPSPAAIFPFYFATVTAAGVTWDHDTTTSLTPGMLAFHVHYVQPLYEGNLLAWMHEVLVGWRPFTADGAKVVAGDETATLVLEANMRPEVVTADMPPNEQPKHVAYIEELTALQTLIINKFDDYYTKIELDATFGNYYTKTEIDTTLNNYYNKAYIDALEEGLKNRDVQSDWNQTDDEALDYIKNKPNIDLTSVLSLGMSVGWPNDAPVPTGWHRCDGTPVDTLQYPDFAAWLPASYQGNFPTADNFIIKVVL